MTWRKILLYCIAGLLLTLSGCRYGAGSSLPEHIRTVYIPTFKNNTFYYGFESRLTRAIIEKMVADPRIKVVQEGEDSLLTGEITEVNKRVIRQTRKDYPSSIRIDITVRITFEDKVEGTMLLDNVRMRSSSSSSAAGVYDLDRGESSNEAEAGAIDELASNIVRRTVGMWK
ncbi:MAG: LptE family protein [Planctomycetes bacterium]|nr:LptE family protein [Planctomycetota bacterium]